MTFKEKSKKAAADRITISLASGQRKILEKIAKKNNATISFVVRYALNEFLEKHEGKQLPLSFTRS
jgi:predicted transcriptional regulator